MPLQLDYYYGGEAEQFSFYRIPKTLFTDPHYRAVSVEAKALYGLMLDRMGLSLRNGWLDEAQRVYIYFTLEDALDTMGIGKDKAVKLFKELDTIGLIERKKQGQGKPAKIYVKNFAVCKESPEPMPLSPTKTLTYEQTSENPKSGLPKKSEAKTSEKPKSKLRESRTQDFGKADSNNTEYNKTERSDTEQSINPQAPLLPPKLPNLSEAEQMDRMDAYREQIRTNIDYDYIIQMYPYDVELVDGYVELMVEVCCSSKTFIRISGDQVPTGVVKSRFLKLAHEHITYVLDSMKNNTTKIGNIKAYTLAALYNAPVTIAQYYTSLVSHDLTLCDA